MRRQAGICIALALLAGCAGSAAGRAGADTAPPRIAPSVPSISASPSELWDFLLANAYLTSLQNLEIALREAEISPEFRSEAQAALDEQVNAARRVLRKIQGMGMGVPPRTLEVEAECGYGDAKITQLFHAHEQEYEKLAAVLHAIEFERVWLEGTPEKMKAALDRLPLTRQERTAANQAVAGTRQRIEREEAALAKLDEQARLARSSFLSPMKVAIAYNGAWSLRAALSLEHRKALDAEVLRVERASRGTTQPHYLGPGSIKTAPARAAAVCGGYRTPHSKEWRFHS